jgi:hypothetical protein
MIHRLPYLQNAVSGFHKQYPSGVNEPNSYDTYIQWMKDQGVIMPISMTGDIDSVRIYFTDPESELLFVLRWA